ncbi:MAG: hypothetical protein K2X01_03470 [Cyanobacteria bacterium]|nr:hypothetical protein [Cyanobacteriota bacterium]
MNHDFIWHDSTEDTLDDTQANQSEFDETSQTHSHPVQESAQFFGINQEAFFTSEQGQTFQHNSRLYLIVSLMLQCDEGELSLLSEVLATIRAWFNKMKR